LEIKEIIESRKVVTEIRFVRPFPGVANSYMATIHTSTNQTTVEWSNASKIKFPMNIMISPIEKMLAKDMDASLSMLKTILEK
jgi:hypothetical protein